MCVKMIPHSVNLHRNVSVSKIYDIDIIVLLLYCMLAPVYYCCNVSIPRSALHAAISNDYYKPHASTLYAHVTVLLDCIYVIIYSYMCIPVCFTCSY